MSAYECVPVSVVVPIYNLQEYLTRCVRSIIRQTHSNLEIILVVAESSDNSFSLCSELAAQDSRITLVKQAGKGLGDARNQGIDIANGEYVCFIDGDDWIEPKYVETLLRIAKDNNCLMATVAKRDAYNEQEIEQAAELNKIMNYRDYLIYIRYNSRPSYSLWGTWLSIYHKSIIKGFRFSLHKRGEECNCWHKLPLAAGQIVVSNQVLYHWLQRAGSLSRPIKFNADFFEFIPPAKEAVEFWEELNEPELAEIYWDVYYMILIQIATESIRDIGEVYKQEIEELILRIKMDKDKAFALSHTSLNLSLSAKFNWNNLVKSKTQFVLYGYGKNGRQLFEWLRHFNIPAIEIWDVSAVDGQMIDNIPIKIMHKGLVNQNVQILCSIQDPIVYYHVFRELRILGYQQIMPYQVLNNAIKYGTYEKYLPFLLEGIY